MPRIVKINYPDRYLFMSQIELNYYVVKEIVKINNNKKLWFGDFIEIGRPLYTERKKIIRRAVWPCLNFKRVITPLK